MLLYLILAAAAAGAVTAVVPWRRQLSWLAAAANGAVLVLGVLLAIRVTRHQPLAAPGGVLRADALSAFMVVVIGAIALLASCQSARYLSAQVARGACGTRHAALYTALVQAFVACMLLAVLADSLGVMWVAVEATTITTTFLVGHRRTDGALEASWKYMVICSAGIALAFLGTALAYYAGLHAAGHPASLDWTSLMAAAPRLDPAVMRLAVALLFLGYGTKVGLVPMHSWLPDAHSQAPAPVSALMSGVLLTVAFYVLLRVRAIAVAAVGAGYPRTLLAIAGLASLVVAASLLLAQRDYKRMLAYHSIEHMGLIALGAAAGSTLAIAAVLLHILGHGLAKGVLFLASGEILLAEGTSDIEKVPALLTRRPGLGAIFAAGLIALLGLPPFSLFVSELNMIRAEVMTGLGWAAAISLACMAVIFAAVMSHGRHLLLGAGPPGERSHATPRAVIVPLAAAMVACALLGVSAWPLLPLLHAAARVVAA
jgi:hydrogenase-4 component F